MKAIILGVAALAVLGGGGFGAYTYFMAPKAEAAVPADEHAAAEEKPAEEDHAAADEHKEPLPLVELSPMIVPVIDREGISQVVSLIIAIEAVDALAADKVKYYEPKLKNAYIREMYGILNRHAALKGGVLQISDLKKHLGSISESILGEHVVSNVVLQVVQQRPV